MCHGRLEVLGISVRVCSISRRSWRLRIGRSIRWRRRNGRHLRGATGDGIRVSLLAVRLDRIPSLGSFGVLDGLEDAGFLEGLEGILLLEVIRVLVLNGHSRSVEGSMRRNLDGGFIGHDGLDPMLCSSSSNSVCAYGANSQCHDTNGTAYSHAPQDITLAGVMGRLVSVQVPLDDLSLLARVVDGGCGHGHADG